MTTQRPALSDLVTAMKGNDTTSKWDVVVSYALESLNQFLASQYQANKLAKNIKLQTELKDDFEGDKTVDYDLHFSSPKLSFNAHTPGTAILTMEIAKGSSYTVTPKSGGTPDKKDFPANTYAVQCVAPMAALSGKTGKVQSAKDIISFEDGTEEEQHIILDFKKTVDTDYHIIPKPDSSGDDLQTLFLPLLANYFRDHINAINYALTTVNNKSEGTGIVLKPKQFAFATSGTLNTGTLSIYILTDASGHGPGEPQPVFKPDGTNSMVPVPEGHTTSVILSYDLITNVYFKSQLETLDDKGNKKYTVQVLAPSEGIDLRLITNESVIADGDSGRYFGGGYDYDGLNIPVDANNPMALTIKDAKYTLKWSGSTTSTWSRDSSGFGPNTSGSHQWGEVKFTITLNKGPTAFDKLTDHELNLMDLQLTSKDFKVDKDGGKCSFKKAISGGQSHVPSYYDNMTLKVPEINFKLAGLNFFLETNLLAPGQEVVSIDTSVGVSTPHDFLLVGSIKSQTTTPTS